MAAHCSLRTDDTFGPTVGSGCRSGFDLTLLFEESFLTIVPAAIFLLLVPVRASRLRHRTAKVARNHGPLAIKQIAIVVLACSQLALLAAWSLRPSHRTKTSLPAATVSFLASLGLFYLSSLEHAKTVRPSSLINLWILISLILDVPQARTLWLRPGSRALPIAFTIALVAKVGILCLEARNKKRSLLPPYRAYAPEALVSLYSQVSLWWINSMFWSGYRSFLSLHALHAIDTDLSSYNTQSSLSQEWLQHSSTSRFSLLWAVIRSVRWTLLSVALPRLCLSALKLSQPLLIARITSLLSAGLNDSNRNEAKGLIGAAALIYTGVAVTTALYQRQLHRTITMIRGSLVSKVCSNVLRLDSAQLSDKTALTLVTADINRVCSSLRTIDDLFATPIEVGVAIYLLQRQIGVSCVAPVALAIAVSLLSFFNVSTAIPMQKKWMAAISARVAYTSSVLGSPKGSKMLGLTDYFVDKIQALRVQELNEYAQYRKYVTWRNILSGIPQSFAPPLALMMFVLIEGRQALNPTSAFTSLALISLVSAPVQSMIHVVPQLMTAMASLDRVQSFLRLEGGHISPETSRRKGLSSIADEGIEMLQGSTKRLPVNLQPLVQLSDVSITVEDKAILRNVDLNVLPRSFNIVLGPVGSGKSTLLETIAGEKLPANGARNVAAGATFSYCAQDPWLPNETIRDIVVAESDYDEEWFNSVIEACTLSSDLQKFAAGDSTRVGAKGVSLSGGQRQRVALARALYARRAVLVADDVFSGLDTNTSQQVFSRVFGSRGICRIHGTAVVLATHSQHYIREADHITVLSKTGEIVEQGSFHELVNTGNYTSSLNIDGWSRIEHQDETIGKTAEAALMKIPPVDKLTIAQQDLARKTGDITVYKHYLQSIGLKFCIILGITIIGFGVGDKAPDLWVRFWSQAEASGNRSISLGVWITVSFLFAFLFIASAGTHIWVMLVHAVPKSSAQLHKQLLHSVMHATYGFFVNTDAGVILNHFSNDMSIIEGELAGAFMMFSDGAAAALAGAALIAAGASYAAIAMPFVMVVLYVLQKFYLRTSRQMRFLDLEAQAPLLTHVTETIAGVTTIRAFGWQSNMHDKCLSLLDKSLCASYLLLCIQRWLNFVLSLITAAIAVVVVSIALTIPESSSAGAIGVSLLGLLNFSSILSLVVTQWTALETSLGAVARCKNMEATTASENLPGENENPPPDWPVHGAVDIKQINAAYDRDVNVLKDLSLSIVAGEKVGICGRSGSGKSSLLLTLLRLLDTSSGSIHIDGVDLAKIPRQMIRGALSSLPQEIVTFPGSVSANLSPLGGRSSEEMESALRKIGLHEIVVQRGGLGADMAALNLSQGQLQLFAVARALLRKSKLLIVDEMSSSVDVATEEGMIEVITKEFAESTVIAVAHRLKTIVAFDKIVVMDSGKIVEIGAPSDLLAQPRSTFRAMWERFEM